jgi:CubicO group peptidase (beta-lactamase class C family)
MKTIINSRPISIDLGRVFALGSSFDRYVASLDQEREPGTYHHYVSMDTQVAGMVIKGATGMTLSSFMENELMDPSRCGSTRILVERQ